MRYLLDTHVFLWANADPDRLGPARDLLVDPESERLVSAATPWEIAIKWALGRLPLPESPATWVPSRISALAATPIAIEHAHVLAVAALPPIHRDPFDRILVAQARMLDAVILTADDAVARYDVEVVRVR